MSLPYTTPSSSPHALTTHTINPQVNPATEDITSLRVNPDGTPFDPATSDMEPLPKEIIKAFEAQEEALKTERLEKEAMARQLAAQTKKLKSLEQRAASIRTTLANKPVFSRLWSKPDPATGVHNPGIIRTERDPSTGTLVAQVCVILNPTPEEKTWQGRTSLVVGETVILDFPVEITTPNGPLTVNATGSLKLTLTKDATAELDQFRRTGQVPSRPSHPDDSLRDEENLFIPSHAATSAGTPTNPPNPTLDRLLDREQQMTNSAQRLARNLTSTLLRAPPSVAEEALRLATLNTNPPPR